MRTIDELLTEVSSLRDLSPEHRATMSGCGRNVVFEPGETIMREGEWGGQSC